MGLYMFIKKFDFWFYVVNYTLVIYIAIKIVAYMLKNFTAIIDFIAGLLGG